MAVRTADTTAPREFLEALTSLRQMSTRPEFDIKEIPGPSSLADYAAALSCDVLLHDDEIASGRFVILYDTSQRDLWGGDLRIVSFSTALIEQDLGQDALLSPVAWSYLETALQNSGAPFTNLGGTITISHSEGYGALTEQTRRIDLEMRASWTPLASDLLPHFQAWCALLENIAGLPPAADEVVPFPTR